MKDIEMLRDFDVPTSPRRIVCYHAGRTYCRVLEFHARAIVAAGAGRIAVSEAATERTA